MERRMMKFNSRNSRAQVFQTWGRYLILSSVTCMVFLLYFFVFFTNSFFSTIKKEFSSSSGTFLSYFSFAHSLHDEENNNEVRKQSAVAVHNVRELQALFEAHDFNLSDIKNDQNSIEVPRLYLTALPQDLKKLRQFEMKKQLFLQALLPMILAENEKILKERTQLLSIETSLKQKGKLSESDKNWLETLTQKYKLKTVSLKELMKRVDIIPPSLALSQAIVETGWGESFAALKKNSAFGMTIAEKVKFYESLQDSVNGYILNLNSNQAYQKMRQIRSQLRTEGKPLCSLKLAETLVRYSELGFQYIGRVKSVIKSHQLRHLDQAQLVRES
jgi:Bax protein